MKCFKAAVENGLQHNAQLKSTLWSLFWNGHMNATTASIHPHQLRCDLVIFQNFRMNVFPTMDKCFMHGSHVFISIRCINVVRVYPRPSNDEITNYLLSYQSPSAPSAPSRGDTWTLNRIWTKYEITHTIGCLSSIPKPWVTNKFFLLEFRCTLICINRLKPNWFELKKYPPLRFVSDSRPEAEGRISGDQACDEHGVWFKIALWIFSL